MADMKDSGIPWIGEIPANWNVKKGKYCLTYLQKPIKEDDEVVTCFRDGEVTLRSKRREGGFTISVSENGYQGIDIGDLVVHGMDGFAGSIGISDSRGKASPVLNVLDTNNNKKYIMYYLRNLAYNGVFVALSTGIRVRTCDTNWRKLKELPFILPPIEEQNTIVAYIDNIIENADLIIANINEQIEILTEYKKSIITEAVTKGLDPDAEMKDSGVEWIGEIPKGWEVSKIKYLFSASKGLSITKENLTEEGLPVVSYGQIHSKTNTGVDISNELLRFIPYDYQYNNKSCKVNKFDFIFADTSEDFDGCGNCVYKRNDDLLFAGYHSIVLHSKHNRDNRYLAFLFLTDLWRKQLRERASGVKVFSITQKNITNSSVVLPSKEEQKNIADYLDKKCSNIDSIIADKKQQLVILEKYKKSLIYEYVTGKKEVSS